MMWAWHAPRRSKRGIGIFTGPIWKSILPVTNMFQYHFMVMMSKSTDKVIASQACTSTWHCLGRRRWDVHTIAFGQCGHISLQGALLYGRFWLLLLRLWTRHFTVPGRVEPNLLWQSLRAIGHGFAKFCGLHLRLLGTECASCAILRFGSTGAHIMMLMGIVLRFPQLNISEPCWMTAVHQARSTWQLGFRYALSRSAACIRWI